MQNRLIQNGQTGGQWYSDTSPLLFPAVTIFQIVLLHCLQGVELLDVRHPDSPYGLIQEVLQPAGRPLLPETKPLRPHPSNDLGGLSPTEVFLSDGDLVLDYKTFFLIFGIWAMCTKRLLVRIRSSLLVTIIYNFAKHNNYLQAHLHQTQTYLQIQELLKHIYKYLRKYLSIL